MEILHIERGKYMGNIDLPGSLSTMSTGEVWHLNPAVVKMGTVRNVCSRLNTSTEKVFSASCPGYSDPFITITRIR